MSMATVGTAGSSAAISASISEMMSAIADELTPAAFSTSEHFSPKRSAWSVSTASALSLDAHTITVALLSPPSAGDSSIVSLESWYGTYDAESLSAEMHFFSASRPKLMFTASRMWSPSWKPSAVPVAAS